MKIWTILAAAPLALLASQALAHNWVAVGTTGIRVDKASLRRGNDGLVYFTENIRVGGRNPGMTSAVVMDCQRRLSYVTKLDGHLSIGYPIEPNSIEEAELKYVCANAR